MSIGGLRDLPERNTVEDEGDVEAPEGERSVVVMWLRKGGGWGGGEGQMMSEDQRIRGPLSPAWRPSQRGGRGRGAWLYSQPGDTRSPSARSGPEP